jgi:hypothetical protein
MVFAAAIKAIGYELNIAYQTVNSHQKSLYKKLGVHSIQELFAQYKSGYTPPQRTLPKKLIIAAGIAVIIIFAVLAVFSIIMNLEQIGVSAGTLKGNLSDRMVNFCKHRSAPQIRQQFLKGMKLLCGNFPPKHGPAFPDCGGGLGVEPLFPGYGITVCGTNGTFLPSFNPRIIGLEVFLGITGGFLFKMTHKIKHLCGTLFGQGFNFFINQFGNRHFKPPVGLRIA